MLRFASSPMGDIHIDNLRVALISYIVAKQKNTEFIVRIEDGNKESNSEEILQVLEKFALPYDYLFYQSKNLHMHQSLAIKLLGEKKAFICTCAPKETEVDYKCNGKCETTVDSETQKIKDNNTPFVIRVKKPHSSVTCNDIIKGKLTFTPDEIDSFIILYSNNTPAYNFATSCDDMLSDIDMIIQNEDSINNASKQIYIQRLLGYEKEIKYAHLPIILNNKDENSVKWLLEQGFLPDAIINYLLLLNNKTPNEIFKLPDAIRWFDINNISKNPAKFDLEKLRFLNTEHLKLFSDKDFSKLFGFSDTQIGKLAKLYIEKNSTLKEIESKMKAIFSPKNFENKYKEEMIALKKIITNAPYFESYDEFIAYLKGQSKLKESTLTEPLRLLLTNTTDGPKLSDIYSYIKPYLLEIIQ